MPRMMDIDEIVRQTIAHAIKSGEILQVGREARQIAEETGYSRYEIARELTEAGLSARINMEMGEFTGRLPRA